MLPAIQIRNLGKQYKLASSQSYLTLRDVLTVSAKKKFNPGNNGNKKFWALKDINADIFPGERVGIIGRNGAGKSTLLKIISRITPPTTGEVIIRGRVSSLLEIGTGFHPELSGRENIFLNGSVLGLKKIEVIRQLDAIISFSGVEKFIDTPLKHYSSGMQMRLAFSVAAHLEPEILLIDEVLAVGDLEFQRKCMGKMEEISKEKGRTILFVSHNLSAVTNLCDKALLLDNGGIKKVGDVTEVVNEYMKIFDASTGTIYKAPDNKHALQVYIKEVFTTSGETKKESFLLDELITIHIFIENNSWNTDFSVGLAINDLNNRRIMIDQQYINCTPADSSIHCKVSLPSSLLTPHRYTIDLSLMKSGADILDFAKDAIKFEIIRENTAYESLAYDYGIINKKNNWEINRETKIS